MDGGALPNYGKWVLELYNPIWYLYASQTYIYIYLESPMTLVNLPFQEKEVFERKHSFLHMSRNVPFCVCPGRSSLDSVLRPFFGVQNASFCVQKASLSVRAGRVRMKIHSAPFFESSSLKTRFSSKNAKIY